MEILRDIQCGDADGVAEMPILFRRGLCPYVAVRTFGKRPEVAVFSFSTCYRRMPPIVGNAAVLGGRAGAQQPAESSIIQRLYFSQAYPSLQRPHASAFSFGIATPTAGGVR